MKNACYKNSVNFYIRKLYLSINTFGIAPIPVGYSNMAYMYILVNQVLFYQDILWLFCSNS